MNTLKCVIIEDQLPAQRILTSYINDVPNLELVNVYTDPSKAVFAITNEIIDILFLDINPPKISGLDFLKTIKHKPYVILTTAFSEYALESFELDVIDYLLKPFSFERFLKAVLKVGRVLDANNPLVAESHVFIKVKGVLQKVRLDDILYIESKGDFSVIRTQKEGLLVNISLKEAIIALNNHFLRCHKSFVVNTKKIEKIVGNQIQFEKHSIPIGRTYKEKILHSINLI